MLCWWNVNQSISYKNGTSSTGKGIETKIWAVGATEVKNHSQDADVILLGPQVRYLEKSIADDANGVPAYLIDMRDYGKMDGKAVLTFALNKLQEVQS